MVVTTGAINRQSKESLPHQRDHILHFILAHGLAHGVIGWLSRVVRSRDKKTGGNNTFGPGLDGVASQLHADKCVIWHILIQGMDDPVTIMPRMITRLIVFESIALAEMRGIQPVPPPAFAIMRRGKQSIDQFVISCI